MPHTDLWRLKDGKLIEHWDDVSAPRSTCSGFVLSSLLIASRTARSNDKRFPKIAPTC